MKVCHLYVLSSPLNKKWICITYYNPRWKTKYEILINFFTFTWLWKTCLNYDVWLRSNINHYAMKRKKNKLNDQYDLERESSWKEKSTCQMNGDEYSNTKGHLHCTRGHLLGQWMVVETNLHYTWKYATNYS